MSTRIKSRSDCPFCEDNVKLSIFAESTNFRAIYNIAPILPGHSLIVPKDHVRRMNELSDEEISEMIIFSRKIANKLTEIFQCSGFNWTIQDGKSAGQTVSHLHLHLIPRHSNDLKNPGDWYPMLKGSELGIIDSKSRDRLKKEEMKMIVDKLRFEFKSVVKK
jgi:bis(5'-adenosyl)-triphosphatase